MEQEKDHRDERLEMERRFSGWLKGRRPRQITVTRTMAFTFSVVLAVTFAAATYGVISVNLQESGWEVEGAQASSSRQVVVEKNLEVKENLEVKRNLEVSQDLRLLGEGSVLDMRGSLPCASEGGSPPGMGRLCFDGV
ncbi:MAG TPA: hypothetical protein VI855_02520, partial [Dehalococcoidia bacterium]|nr:hypothetical protein [Dehalococcoidia bacterium]